MDRREIDGKEMERKLRLKKIKKPGMKGNISSKDKGQLEEVEARP